MQNSETRPITLLFDLETTPLSQEDVELHCLVTLDYETGETTRYNDTGAATPRSHRDRGRRDAPSISANLPQIGAGVEREDAHRGHS